MKSLFILKSVNEDLSPPIQISSQKPHSTVQQYLFKMAWPALAGNSFSLDRLIAWLLLSLFFFYLNQVIHQMCRFSALTALLFFPPHRSLGLHERVQGAGTLGPVLEPLSDAAQHEHGLWTASVYFLQDSFTSPGHQEGKLLPGPLA